MLARKLNWVRDSIDHRDLSYGIVVNPHPAIVLPPSADLRPNDTPIMDQGQIGSCTSQAWGGLMDFIQMADIKKNQLNAPEVFKNTFDPVSRLFIYYNERVLEGDPGQDGGAQLRDGAMALMRWGVCEETLWPYDPNQIFVMPNQAAFLEAAKRKITTCMKLHTPFDFKHCLSSGNPIVFGATLFDSFESDQVAANGIVPMPTQYDSPIGGHATMIVGYDDAKQWYIVRNSWGNGWGDKGYFYLPYAYAHNSQWCSDFWTAK